MEDPSVEKIAISGPALASMIQRFSTSRGAVDGLIFGHVSLIAPTLSDDDSSSSSSSSTLIATVTSFFCSNSSLSFYTPSGRVDPLLLRRLAQPQPPSSHLLGWFSGRRRTHLRPSLREFAVSNSLISNPNLTFPIQNSPVPIAVDLKPCLFFLFASPISDQTIHTHEYRAYQFRSSAHSFDPKSIDIVNIGPAFRGHYGAFSPNSQLPALPCELRVSPMNVDKGEESLGQLKKGLKAQSELDMCAEGLEVSSLSRLMGSEAVNYTSGVEELYEKMLVKIESLARQVENSSAKIREQEDHNRKLRHKATRTAGL
ncbi:putative FAM175 family protein [Rosa chinensis]|uniref:Putative FAM175 family protein n=1 Tax=Rosa chinensis TaxID=74649 RepID=A0A2P6R8P1_ROSCH|nr:uncharacterized protein LOC112191531 [Rosa chinensis]XP_024186663.1 uncharacterized protein LOC112191531 [Rosa chinensis]XP_024186664.1 uncharacterized protein LOC112191531 [Rosa chinensis]PRQ42808.1 putative FAM175 family protein [Rosa chinensis]